MNSSLKIILVLNFLVIFSGVTPVFTMFSRGFQQLNGPVEAGFSGLNKSLLTSLDFLASLPKIYGQNGELKKELAKYRELETKYYSAVSENGLLRSQLKVTLPKRNNKLVLATVLGRSVYDGLVTLSLGKDDGINAGDFVTANGVLLGRISSVSDQRSKLLLTVSPESRFEAVTSNLQAKGEVVGNFGNRLLLTKVLPSQPLNVGDVVLDFESRLILGKVEKVQAEGAKIFKEADVSVLYDPEFLTEVFVIIDQL